MNGIKFVVVMKDGKGRDYFARVKARNIEEAKAIVAQTWPKYNMVSIQFRGSV